MYNHISHSKVIVTAKKSKGEKISNVSSNNRHGEVSKQCVSCLSDEQQTKTNSRTYFIPASWYR